MAGSHSLAAYGVTRLLLAIPMLLILLTAVFLILRVLPGDPVLALWGGRTPPPDVVERARVALGLDQPPWVQYWRYMTGVLQGQLGRSIGENFRGQLVWDQIALRLPATIEIAIDSLLEGNLAHFQEAVAHLILPSMTLGLVLSGFFTKSVRANMIRTMMADFTDAARARGLPRRQIVYKHAFKNALVPVVTVLGLQFAILFAGAVLTEKTFSIDGIGVLLLNSITDKDMTMIQGVVVVYATIIVIVSLVIDILGAVIDPRIRL